MVLNARYLTKEEGRNQMRIKCTKLLGTGQFEREKKRKSDERMKAERMASFFHTLTSLKLDRTSPTCSSWIALCT